MIIIIIIIGQTLLVPPLHRLDGESSILKASTHLKLQLLLSLFVFVGLFLFFGGGIILKKCSEIYDSWLIALSMFLITL